MTDTIVAGPSRIALLSSLLANDLKRQRVVTFEIDVSAIPPERKISPMVDLVIDKLERNESTGVCGEILQFTGRICTSKKIHEQNVQGLYNIDTRTGSIDLSDIQS